MNTLESQIDAQIARNDAVLKANGVPVLPSHRVHVLWHPRGWQVATVKHDVVEILTTVHADAHDANVAAARISVYHDMTLCLWDDEGGEFADLLIRQVEYAEEQYDRATAWMN